MIHNGTRWWWTTIKWGWGMLECIQHSRCSKQVWVCRYVCGWRAVREYCACLLGCVHTHSIAQYNVIHPATHMHPYTHNHLPPRPPLQPPLFPTQVPPPIPNGCCLNSVTQATALHLQALLPSSSSMNRVWKLTYNDHAGEGGLGWACLYAPSRWMCWGDRYDRVCLCVIAGMV